MTDIADLISDIPNPAGDDITHEFRTDIVPRLGELTRDEMWMLAGMLLYLGNDAEARAITEYVVSAGNAATA